MGYSCDSHQMSLGTFIVPVCVCEVGANDQLKKTQTQSFLTPL